MEHRFITMGELLLRLSPPDHNLIKTSTSFDVRYGGSEANIAIFLAGMHIDSSYFTVVPDQTIGHTATQELKKYDVDCSRVIYSTPQETPSFRLGTYYLENGFGLRNSSVIYDRKHSAITEYNLTNVDLEEMLQEYTWLHVSGITPALCQSCADFIMSAIQIAKEIGLTVSFDGNFRSTLWSWQEARDFCTQCLPYVDVLFGIEPYHLYKDPHHPEVGDVKDDIPYLPNIDEQKTVFKTFVEQYPNIQCIARHVRHSISGNVNSLKAYLWYRNDIYESQTYTFDILDRVGGGDGFAAGIIYALMKEFNAEEITDFGVASSVLTHTIHGDANLITDERMIRNLMNQNFDIKR